MRHLAVLYKTTDDLLHAFAKKYHLEDPLSRGYKHAQEDYLMVAEPFFVVSDGVTLDYKKLIKEGRDYPNPSPAGEVAETFCKKAVESAESRSDNFNLSSAEDVFQEANAEVGRYNREVGKTDISGNITGLYSATGAFVMIRGDKAYWVSICDSFVAHFDKGMKKKFMSSGSCDPYAVINGEERMVKHLEKGVLNLEKGDRLFVYTDGFANYVEEDGFLELFLIWDESLESRIEGFSKKASSSDPDMYGHERSLIVIEV